MLSASRQQPHLLHVSAVDRRVMNVSFIAVYKVSKMKHLQLHGPEITGEKTPPPKKKQKQNGVVFRQGNGNKCS